MLTKLNLLVVRGSKNLMATISLTHTHRIGPISLNRVAIISKKGIAGSIDTVVEMVVSDTVCPMTLIPHPMSRIPLVSGKPS